MISFDSFLIKPPFDGEMMGLCDVVPEKPVTVHSLLLPGSASRVSAPFVRTAAHFTKR